MHPALVTLCKGYLNLLLFSSPTRLFHTINNDEAYHAILTQWTASLLSNTTQRVLELGCGPGNLSCHLAALGKDVTGIDLSGKMIQKAKQESKRRGLQSEFLPGDAANTSLDPSSYDLVIGASIINVVKDPQPVISETWRLLKSNGTASFLFPTHDMTTRKVRQHAMNNNLSPFSTAVLATWAKNARKLSVDSVKPFFVKAGFNNILPQSFMNGMVCAATARK